MKNYNFKVKGINSSIDEEKVCNIVREALKISECTASEVSGTVSFSSDTDTVDTDALSDALKAGGYELSMPVENRYAYVGEKRKPVKRVPLYVMLTVVAITAVFSIMFTYIFAGGFYKTSGSSDSSGYESITSDGKYPEYFDDLDRLDEIFKSYYYYDVNDSEMGEKLLKAYIDATGDKYAEYYNAEEYDQLLREDSGNSAGIGVSVTNSSLEINGYSYKALQIIAVYKDAPAYTAGVQVGDYVMLVGEGSDRKSVDELGYTMALEQLRGEVGTSAKFSVYRADDESLSGYKEISFSIERAEYVIESVSYNVCSTDNRVGIVTISQFDLTTPPQFSAAVDALIGLGCEYFIFDVRNNPGGDLKSIEAVLSYFLDKGSLIVSTENRNGDKSSDYVSAVKYSGSYEGCSVSESDIGKYKNLKKAVLVNGNTASAAELFTATFKDYSLGDIVGTKTYGKGCMQYVIPLSRYGLKGGLRVTTAMYFSKSHNIYHDIGIEPDYTVELDEEAQAYNFYLLPHDKDNQLQYAISQLVK